MSLILFSILVYFFATANYVHGRNCELEIDIEKNCYKQYTENYNYHHFFPVEKSNKNDDTSASVTFFVKADANAHILLSPTSNQTENDPAYEIILGSANNTASEIRRGHKAKSERAIMMKDAVNRTDWKGYWIRINLDGSILVGKKDEDLPFLHWKDPKPLPVKFYGFSSWDNTVALWAHQCIRNNESSLESAQQPVERSIDPDGEVLSRIGFSTDSEEENSCQNYTTETSSYTEFFKIEKPNKTSNLLVNLTFYVLAESNAHVMLSSTLQPSEYEPVYEIVLGAANNTMSEIRRMQKAKSKSSVKMTDAVSQNNWKGYWIRISNDGLVQVGREAEDKPFLYWKDPYPLQVKYYSFSTWDNVPTSWKHQCSNRIGEVAQSQIGQTAPRSGQNFWDLYSTKNVKNQTCKIIRTRFFYHEYFPVDKPTNTNSDDLASIVFYVQAKSDAHIFLSPRRNPNLNEPGYEIVLGSENNTASVIRRGQKAENKVIVASAGVVSANEWRGFWIRVKSTGLIMVGKEGEDWPLMYWQDEKPLQINYYSLSSGISSDVLWEHQCSQVDAQPQPLTRSILTDEDTPPPPESCQTIFTFNYTYTQFFPMEKSNLNGDNFVFVAFQVKADSNAHILLSRTPKPTATEPAYEIVLGSAKNIATEIRKGQKTENRAMKYITNVVSHDEWKGYWIRVESDGLIMVGNEGEDFPFMYWKDPEPIKVEYYSFSSWLDTTALWKHHCPQSAQLDEKSQKNVTKNNCKAFYTQGYNYFPLYPYEKSNKKSNLSFELTFDVKADNLASVLLSTTPRPSDKEIVYEIIFASENNTLSEIRRGQKADTRTMAVVVMTDMTPRNEWKKYWIQILNDGSILVGKVGDDLNLPFMRWKDPKPLQIKYYGFSSSTNSIALWQHQCTPRNEQPVQVDSRSNVRLQQSRRARV